MPRMATKSRRRDQQPGEEGGEYPGEPKGEYLERTVRNVWDQSADTPRRIALLAEVFIRARSGIHSINTQSRR